MNLYSVRMRAAEAGGAHISGAERLVDAALVEETVQQLLRRALTHEKGEPAAIHLTVEVVERADVAFLEPLPVKQHDVQSVEEGHRAAVSHLLEAGVAACAAQKAVDLLVQGPAPDGGAMRGAIVMDAETGQRLEADRARGVRVTQLDWEPDALTDWKAEMEPLGIASERVAEALALATKVVATPGTVAELCWSDDPGYVGGYVAARGLGYVRIPRLKELGSPLGGRVFFVRGVGSVSDYEKRLQAPVQLGVQRGEQA